MDINSKTDFYMTLESNSSINIFSSNTVNNFKVLLPQRLQLESNYEVALTEVHLPSLWNNIHHDVFYKYYEIIDSENALLNEIHSTNFISKNENSKLTFNEINTINLNNGQYTNEELINSLNKIWNNFVIFSLQNDKCKISLEENIKLEMSMTLSRILGFDDFILINKTKSRREFFSTEKINLFSGMNSLYIYCNIIENQITSDIFSPLLRIIHFDRENNNEKKNTTLTKTFAYPFYLPLRYKNFQIIEVNIRNTTGDLIEFLPTSHCILTLHFKKK